MAEDGSGESLLRFLSTAAPETLPATTVSNWRAAALKVLDSVPDWRSRDLRTLDVAATLVVFAAASDVGQATRDAYEARFRKLLATFAAWCDDPSGQRWHEVALARTPRGRDRQPRQGTRQSAHRACEQPVLEPYRFQVRRGVWAELHLPADLTEVEAQRLSMFVLTLGLG